MELMNLIKEELMKKISPKNIKDISSILFLTVIFFAINLFANFISKEFSYALVTGAGVINIIITANFMQTEED